jgi:alkaline phosphatase D
MNRRTFLAGSVASVVYVACSSDEEIIPGTSSSGNGGSSGSKPDGGIDTPDGAIIVPPSEPVTKTSDAKDSDTVFPQGLMSGDPRPDGIVLWTRVDPVSQKKTSKDDLEVQIIIAKDEALTEILFRGKVIARGAEDNTVRVSASGMQSATIYYYRFEIAGVTTRVGRTKTAPSEGSDVPVRFVMAACQDQVGRYYHAWRALLEEKPDLDFVLYLGDYIYETTNDERFQTVDPNRGFTLPNGLDTSPEQNKSRIAAGTLEDYRACYKHYRKDEYLKEVHRLYPFILTWDDHEFSDDCWQDHSTSFNEKDPVTGGLTTEQNTPRRMAANRAFFEYQPMTIQYDESRQFPDDITIYRKLSYGKNVDIFMTDQRMYRSDHVIPEGPSELVSLLKPANSMIGSRYFVRKSKFDPIEKSTKPTLLGGKQKAWFLDAVKKSKATWKVWGNEVQMWQMALQLNDLPNVPGIFTYTVYVNCDQWDGYRTERAEILSAFEQAKVENLLVCTGDIHAFFASEIHVDFDNPGPKPIATEYVTAGIGSASLRVLVEQTLGPNSQWKSIADNWANNADSALQKSNPHLKFSSANGYGFTLMTIDKDKVEATMVETQDPRDKTYKGIVRKRKLRTKAGTNRIELIG